MISLTYNKPPRIFQLLHCHGYLRFTSPPRIRQLITPVFFFIVLFVSFFECLSLFFFFFYPVAVFVSDTCALCCSLFLLISLCLCFFLFSTSLCVLQEFFKNLSHWMDQHAAMNDAGNFLIETCDETVSLDLKQQLLLLNGRWRDLFLKVKQVTEKTPTH